MIEAKKSIMANPGRPFISKIGTDITTPAMLLVKSCIKTGHTYANQATRYYLITSLNPEGKEILKFLEGLEEKRRELECEIFLMEESKPINGGVYVPTGNYVMKFTSKVPPPVFSEKGEELEITKELPPKTPLKVEFETYCYLDKITNKYKFTFTIKKIIIVGVE